MICEECGKRIHEGANSCYACGATAGAAARSIAPDDDPGKSALIMFVVTTLALVIVFCTISAVLVYRGEGIAPGRFQNTQNETITIRREFFQHTIEFPDGSVVPYRLITSYTSGRTVDRMNIMERPTGRILGTYSTAVDTIHIERYGTFRRISNIR